MGGDHGHRTRYDCTSDALVIEGPEIFLPSPASADYPDVGNTPARDTPESANDLTWRAIALTPCGASSDVPPASSPLFSPSPRLSFSLGALSQRNRQNLN